MYLFQRYRLQAENMAYHPQSINRILFTLPYRQLVIGTIGIEGKYNNQPQSYLKIIYDV